MKKIKIIINLIEENGWRICAKNKEKLYIKGYFYNKSYDQVLNDLCSLKKYNIDDYLNSLDGCFSLVFERDESVLVAMDKIRSTPLFYTEIDKTWIIDSHAPSLIKKAQITQLNYDAVLALKMSGYTINKDTIYKELKTLIAGECIIFEDNKTPKRHQYYQYQPWNIKNNTRESYRKELAEVTLNILRKIIKDLHGRQIIIPLSAGNDSRLIASGLRHLGYKNVRCYSYGIKGNFESKIAQKVAGKLGYKFKFIPLTTNREKRFYKSKEFQEYLSFSDTCTAAPYIQSLSTIKYLKDMEWIDNDAVFINGNSGDFISGGHITELMKSINGNMSEETRQSKVLDKIINKHYSLWGHLKTEKNLFNIKQQLLNEMPMKITTPDKGHGIYEYSEFINRQSKYVISGQRAYEFYGYEWRLPLWDMEYLKFWEGIPAKYKNNQSLYIEMLENENWGDVWEDDIPINNKTLRPLWVIPLRFLFKIPFSLFGNKGKDWWHQFDINVFYYWRDVTRMMCTTKYIRVLADLMKKPQNHVSWQSEDYLNKKDINV